MGKKINNIIMYKNLLLVRNGCDNSGLFTCTPLSVQLIGRMTLTYMSSSLVFKRFLGD